MAVNAAKAVLKEGKTALLICDLQEKLLKATLESKKIIQNSSRLVCMSFFYWYILNERSFNIDIGGYVIFIIKL